MHQKTTYSQFLRRLPRTEKPFRICRLCVQETQNLCASSDADWSEIRILYEKITKLPLLTGTMKYPDFVCTECTSMLREINEFLEMINNADIFWKYYRKEEEEKAVNDARTLQENDTTIESEVEEIDDQLLEETVISLQISDASEQVKNDDIEIATNSNASEIAAVSFPELSETETVDLPCPKRFKRNIFRKTCWICEKEFLRQYIYERHMTMHSMTLNCAHCGMTFKTKSLLLAHLQEIHSKGVATDPNKAVCTKCDREYTMKKRLRYHVLTFHIEASELNCCKVCKKTFSNAKRLMVHKQQHRQRRHQCSQCPKSFLSKTALRTHAAKHSNFRPFICESCGIGTKSKLSLLRHIDGIHKMKKQKIYKPVRSMQCSMCPETFSKLRSIKGHFAAMHSTTDDARATKAWKVFRSMCCCQCSLKFDSSEQLQEHYGQYAATHDKPMSTRLRISKSVSTAARHKGDWSQLQRPYECEICKNTFKTPDTLSGHMKTHSKKPRPFKCEICEGTYLRSNDLRMHMLRAHTVERPFSCSDCAYRCLTQYELNSHNRWIHSAMEMKRKFKDT